MTIEWGVFNDEGCIESQLWTEGEAQVALGAFYSQGERHLSIDRICPEHEEQPASACEECLTEMQQCTNCGDEVHALSSRGWCDGCEEEVS